MHPTTRCRFSRGAYPRLEFCVQYRESALNFVSRLMEEGRDLLISSSMRKNRHVMVIADANVRFPWLPNPKLTYANGNLQSGQVTEMGA